MSEARRWSHLPPTPEQQAYGDGEYDGYWGVPHRDGTSDNPVWVAYFRGYVAGIKERAAEPSDEQIDAWMRSIADAIGDGER